MDLFVGILDENQNLVKDPGEKKVYFEFSDYSTSYTSKGHKLRFFAGHEHQ